MIIRENINFERGSDPKSVMDLGVISKIKKILNDFNYRTEYVRYSGIIDGTPYQSNLPNEGSDDVWIYIHYQNNGNKEQFEKDTEWAEKFIDYRSFIRGTHERWPTGYARINTEYKELFLNAQKNLRESLDFERGQDPKKSLRIGTHHLIPQIIEKFEESEFELSQRGEVLDLILNYELSPDHFHNPAGYPKYDWEFVYLSRDFEVAILYMIDLRNSEILRKMEVSNPGIDAEYIDKQNWKITSMSPDKIYEEINQDYALIDIADAAEYLWNAYQKQVAEEESFEEEEILEHVDFQRGMDPKQSMGIGRVVNILGKKEGTDFRSLVLYKAKDVIERSPEDMDLGEMVFFVEIVSCAGCNSDKKGQKMVVRKFDEPFGKYWGLEWDLKLGESVNFERGMDPKHAMEIGSKYALIKKICKIPVFFIDRTNHPDERKFWSYNSSDGREWDPHKMDKFLSLETLQDVYFEITKGNPELRESVNFERGIDPKDAILGPEYRMFSIVRHKMLNLMKSLAEKYNASIVDESDQERIKIGVITPIKNGKILIELGRGDLTNAGDSSDKMGVGYYLANGKKTSGIGVSVGEFKEGLEKYEYELQEAIGVVEKWLKHETGVAESLDFERGIDPKQSMGIGLQKQIIKALWGLTQERGTGSINIMQNRDSVWLKVDDYNADADTFIKNVHKHFSEDFFSDIEQKNILKKGGSWRCTFHLIIKPKYWNAFKGSFTSEGFIKESLNFERGMDPKTSMKIGGIRPVDQLKKDYNRIVDLIQTQKYLDFQVPFTGEANDLIEVNIHFGWGNIQNNFKNMGREELYPFEILVQKYTKLLGLNESVRFERGIDPKISMDIGMDAQIDNFVKHHQDEFMEGSLQPSDYIWVCAALDQVDFVKYLISKKVNIHVRQDKALRFAAARGSAEIVKILLKAGADPSAEYDQAIGYAVSNNNLEMLQILLDYGADPFSIKIAEYHWINSKTAALLHKYMKDKV